MQANVLAYVPREGAEWRAWPWPASCKPTNPELICHAPSDLIQLFMRHPCGAVIMMHVHALWLSDGTVWDARNGFRSNARGGIGNPIPKEEAQEWLQHTVGS